MIATPCIYLIKSPSFRYYVGQTNNFNKRLNSYKNVKIARNNTLIQKSLLKYGFENHSIDIIQFCDEYELDKWEVFYIKLLDTFNTKHGLNLTSGGGRNFNVVFKPKSAEWKLKASLSKKGKKRPIFNKEWRKKISESLKNRVIDDKYRESMKKSVSVRKSRYDNWFEQETKDKISYTLKKFYQTDEGLKIRNSISERCRKTFSIRTFQYSKNGELIKEWENMRDASKELNICNGDISRCCNGKLKSAGGFIWKKININNDKNN